MGVQLSKPEQRAIELFKRTGLSVEPNDGTHDSIQIYFREDKKGTSIIKDGCLLWEKRNKVGERTYKNYKLIRPDFRFGGDFIEIKDNISGNDWDKLSRDALNDNIRLALLRLNKGDLYNYSIAFDELMEEEKKMVSDCLKGMKRSKPDQRVYLRWSDLTQLIPSPNQNLALSEISHNGVTYPIKAVPGLNDLKAPVIYYLNNEIMDQWDNLIK